MGRKQMEITRYTRQIAFEAWKSDIEALFNKCQPSTKPDPFDPFDGCFLTAPTYALFALKLPPTPKHS